MRVVPRDHAPLHAEPRLFGDDVEDGAAGQGADMHGGVRRVEAGSERALRRDAALLGRDPGHRLGRRIHRVHAARRGGGVAGAAPHRHVGGQAALVAQHRLHAGRLAHDAQRRRLAALRQVDHQPAGTAAIHFLVIGDEQVDRAAQPGRLEVRHRGQAAGDEALHVGAPRATSRRPARAQREGIGAPGLAIHRHGVDVAGQRDAARARPGRRRRAGWPCSPDGSWLSRYGTPSPSR